MTPSIEELVHVARREVLRDFEATLRAQLEVQPREWLVDQLEQSSLTAD